MSRTNLGKTIRLGLLAGLVVLSVSVIGMVEAFNERDIIVDWLTMGQVLLFGASAYVGYKAAETYAVAGQRRASPLPALLSGLLAGFISAIPLVLLVLIALSWTNIRDYLVNVSPALIDILTFGRDNLAGSLIMAAVMSVLGLLGAILYLLPGGVRKPVIVGLATTLIFGVFSEVPLNIFRQVTTRDVIDFLFGTSGITPQAAILAFVIGTLLTLLWDMGGAARYRQLQAAQSPQQQQQMRWVLRLIGIAVLLILPWISGVYLTDIYDRVGIFILMGLGLNIVVGFAGLLDLGYVAFFAIGAYVMGLMTSDTELGMGLSFWVALPLAVLAATLAGVLLGIPVLRMRGDYLAIVTLGFGEIIRVLVRSDLLGPIIGGAQGIIRIGRPQTLDFVFVQPQHYYYLILAGCFLAAFVSWRLRDSRLGRRWMAMREDETVAEAVGIHLVNTKLLAFAIGAAFSGLAGAVFASRLGSIFPNSFELLISIQVLAVIIIGGMGSLPGVVVGALVLVGLPELLREFEEYRLLIYGVLLIGTMLLRPAGLWPSPIRRLELHSTMEEGGRLGEPETEFEPAGPPQEVQPMV
jgi:branched-chain amino acid transport system permease protein